MAVELEIQDGSPYWWNSADIWVVPGNDPGGSPGQPIAGQAAYLWAKVHNIGSSAVISAQVNFYWSNPAAGVFRSTSILIGSSFVDIEPSDTQDVLCLTPWIPMIVNDGHECVVAEIIHADDPLPLPLSDPFYPPIHLQIAQRNLSVLAINKSMTILPIQISAPVRENKSFEVMVEFGDEIDQRALEQLGVGKLKFSKQPIVNIDISLNNESEIINNKQCRHLNIDLALGTSMAIYLKVEPCNLKRGDYTTINLIALEDGSVVGGVTFIATSNGEE